MTPEEYNNNLFPFLSAPKETPLIPSKPKTAVGPEVPQTKPGNLKFATLKTLLWHCLSYASRCHSVLQSCDAHDLWTVSMLFSSEYINNLYQRECPRIASNSMESRS